VERPRTRKAPALTGTVHDVIAPSSALQERSINPLRCLRSSASLLDLRRHRDRRNRGPLPAHRFSGVALSFNLSFTLFSGLAPVIAALLARNTGVAANAAYFMIGCAFLTFVAALVMRRFDGRILADLETRQELARGD
jgi:hypothetical protein